MIDDGREHLVGAPSAEPFMSRLEFAATVCAIFFAGLCAALLFVAGP